MTNSDNVKTVSAILGIIAGIFGSISLLIAIYEGRTTQVKKK